MLSSLSDRHSYGLRECLGVAAQVGLDDAGVVRDVVEAALGDLDPVVERHDAVGDPLDDVHVVLDHEDRESELVAQAGDHLGHLVRLLRVHPGGRLVEQQQPRLGGERAGDLEPAAVGVGEHIRGLVPAVAHQPLTEEPERPSASSLTSRSSRCARGRRRTDSAGEAWVWP